MYTLLKPDVMRPKTASKGIIRHAMYYLLLSFKNASRTIFTMVVCKAALPTMAAGADGSIMLRVETVLILFVLGPASYTLYGHGLTAWRTQISLVVGSVLTQRKARTARWHVDRAGARREGRTLRSPC